MVGPGGVDRMDYLPFGGLARSVSGGTVRYLFTGQEFDENTGLHNFRARLYDPAAGRFLSVDPAGQFHSPYSYAGGNPVSVIDPNGEFAFTAALIGAAIGAAVGGASYTAHAAITRSDWSLGGFALSAGMGALQGALSGGFGAYEGLSVGQQFLAAGVEDASSYLPNASVSGGGVGVGASPAFSFGTNGFSIGLSVFSSVRIGRFSLSAGAGSTFSQGGPAPPNAVGPTFVNRYSGGIGYRNGDYRADISLTHFSGPEGALPQTIGSIGGGTSEFYVRTDNDLFAGTGDKFRTAGGEFRSGPFSVGFKLFTGNPEGAEHPNDTYVDANGSTANVTSYRLGAVYLGLKQNGHSFQVGAEGDRLRGFIQNNFHRHIQPLLLLGKSPKFKVLNQDIDFYTNSRSYSPFTIY